MGHALFLSEADLIALHNNPLPKEAFPTTHTFIGRIGALLSLRIWRMTALRRTGEIATNERSPRSSRNA